MLELGLFTLGVLILVFTLLSIFLQLVVIFIKYSWFLSSDTSTKSFSHKFSPYGLSLQFTLGIVLIYLSQHTEIVRGLL